MINLSATIAANAGKSSSASAHAKLIASRDYHWFSCRNLGSSRGVYPAISRVWRLQFPASALPSCHGRSLIASPRLSPTLPPSLSYAWAS